MPILRFAVLLAFFASLSVASAVFESGCTTMSGGGVIASHSFDTLLPEGMDAACQGVNFHK